MRQTGQIRKCEFIDADNEAFFDMNRHPPCFYNTLVQKKSTRHNPFVLEYGVPLQGVVVGHSHGIKWSSKTTSLWSYVEVRENGLI
jgi:hypothetical protein